MSCITSCCHEFSLALDGVIRPKANTSITLRIVNIAISILAPAAGLCTILTVGHLGLFGIAFAGNFVVRSLAVDYLLIRSILPSGYDALDLLSHDLDMVSGLTESNILLLNTAATLLQVLKISAIVGLVFGAYLAYKHRMYPESYH